MTSMRTLAPLPRHWSAWVFCFWASLSALVIVYVTPAFLNAAISAGLSNFSQRTDDAVSGSRTQMSPPAAFLLVPAVAPATTIAAMPTTTASISTVDLRKTFFTESPPVADGTPRMLGGWGEAGAVGRLLDGSTLHDSTARVKSFCVQRVRSTLVTTPT